MVYYEQWQVKRNQWEVEKYSDVGYFLGKKIFKTRDALKKYKKGKDVKIKQYYSGSKNEWIFVT